MEENNVIAFTRGVPPSESFPVKKLEECTLAVLDSDSDRLLQYGKAGGYPPLRKYFAEQYHVDVERVLIGQGSLQILDTLVRVSLKPDDYVFLEQPTYDRSLTIFRRSGVRLVGIDLNQGVLDMEGLEEKLAGGLTPRYFYIIPDFQNPSGSVLSLAHRKKLIQLAKTYNFLLIEDGPYHDLRYYGEDLPSLFEMAPEQVIYMSSFSKLISPGMRVGFMILPPDLARQVRKFSEDTYINASYLNQAIAYEFIRRGWLAQNLQGLKQLYRPRLDAVLQTLDEEFAGMADWVKPQGGFFVGLNIDPDHDIPTKAEVREAGLALSDSRGFFIKNGERFIRLPFCALTPEQIREGITRLKKLIAP
jgi:2-aminoadipate transaminase